MASAFASTSKVMLPSRAAATTITNVGCRIRSIATSASASTETTDRAGEARSVSTSSKASADESRTTSHSTTVDTVETIPSASITDVSGPSDAAKGASSHQESESQSQGDPVATSIELRRIRREMLDDFQHLGSTQNRSTAYRPHQARFDPKAARSLTLSHLIAANAHVGHHRSQTLRAYHPLLLGFRQEMGIINLEKHTLPALKRCANVVRTLLARDGIILFVGTGKGQAASIQRACQTRLGSNAYHVTTKRWIPGTLTNAPKLLASAILRSLDDGDADVTETPDTTRLASQTYQPDLVIVLNPRENPHAVREATDRRIPTMAIVDSNVDPRFVTYAIPGNDDSLRFVDLVVGVLARAGEEGLKEQITLREEAEMARSAKERERRRIAARDGLSDDSPQEESTV